ncbi:glycosyltransferase [Knoellia sp. Soil729]|uniref:glycosyltransferase n=1 Tax=Knoellia sp. Soil729 TaxID=1736394 RepID=UPI000AB2BBAB|nr:glycosyltransferase [Knoellia sp. Soil729]
MKIAMISEHASPLAVLGGVDAGGQNVHVDALARGLARRGHVVEVFTRRDDLHQPECVPLAPGVTVVHVPVGPARAVPKDDLYPLMDQFADWVQDHWSRHGDPDVVHAHFWMSGLAAVRAGRARGVPVVQTFHALGSVKRRFQGAADTSPPERLAREHELAAEVDVVVATCADEVAELARTGVDTAHVRVVPCGVDTTHFTPVPAADEAGAGPAQRAPGRQRLLLVGRMVERKGFDVAIRALADLPESVELVIAGGPAADQLDAEPEVMRLRRVAREVGVFDRVRMLGQLTHSEMPSLYRSADVVLATPWYEPFGITPLEAAACGRPVVGSAVGGLLDSVVDGETGRLVPPRDPLALARAVEDLLADPATSERWGTAARARAVTLYDWSIVTERTEQALVEAVSRHASTVGAALARSAADEDATLSWLQDHAAEVEEGAASLMEQYALIRQWGEQLATSLVGGARLLAAGNGGSAAEAQHLTAELVGRFRGERRPLSAISLCAESSSVTAILNDYGPDEVFARQVEAHGRAGDILVLLSTSGTSSNIVHAAKRGRELGLQVWALTGPGPNPLAALSDHALTISAGSTAAVQELHLTAVHAMCAALDHTLRRRGELLVRSHAAVSA